MSFKLSDLLSFDDIVIQCHDNPDADALASGFALYTYLESKGKKPQFIYGGVREITKSNLVLMKDTLNIPVKHVEELVPPELLVTVDCQHGERNVQRFEAKNIAIIDHHKVFCRLPEMSDVRSKFGSCSTVIWKLLQKEGFHVNENEGLATALYYGLMTDTSGFVEISHPADKDLRDSMKFNNSQILMFKNNNISMDELEIASEALKSVCVIEGYKSATALTAECDPNILGLISDMLLEVDAIETCVVFSFLEKENKVKLSVRSCVKETRANELAEYIAREAGNGGGHEVKAGGVLFCDALESLGVDTRNGSSSVKDYIEGRIKSYFDQCEILYYGKEEQDRSLLKEYRKIPVNVGYVVSSDLAPTGTRVTVRTIEGDVDTMADPETYIMIGVDGEVYPTTKKVFEEKYQRLDVPYVYPELNAANRYTPAVLNRDQGENVDMLPYVHSCISKGGDLMLFRQIDHIVKIFSHWDPDHYYLGNPGDYLAVYKDNLSKFYIVKKDIFEKTYKEI